MALAIASDIGSVCLASPALLIARLSHVSVPAAAIFQYKVILAYLLERFKFEDAGMDITLKIASSLQAWVKDRPDLGACLPVHVDLL